MRLRHIPSPAGLIKHTSRRPHEGTEDHRFSNITAASAEGQFGDLEAEAGGCTWMLKMHLKSAMSSGVARRLELLPLDGHLTFQSRDSLFPLQSPPSLFPSPPSPPSIRYTVCLHAQRVNRNPFTQLYPSYIGALKNQTPLWPLSPLHQEKKECSFLFPHLWLQQQTKQCCRVTQDSSI